jgi:aspartate/methionine/tyrosine aminotransferase
LTAIAEVAKVAVSFLLTKLLIRSHIARFLPSVRRLTDGAGAFLHYYSDRVLASPLQEVREATAFSEIHGPDAIDLSLGAPRFDLVPSSSTKLPAGRRGVPAPGGLYELRKAVADKLHADYHLELNPAEEVLITPGAAGAFNVLLDTFMNPGQRVVLFDPTSPLYPLALKHRRARIHWIPTWMEEGRIRFRSDDLARAMRRARLIVVTSPNNPTGGVFSAEDLEQIAWYASRRDVLIVHDTAFERYQYDGDRVSIGSFPTAGRRTLTVGSMSKGHALASARVGWLVGYRHLARPCAMSALLQTMVVPSLCQHLALAALRQGDETFTQLKDEFAARRRYTYERLQSMGLKPDWPAGGYFFWIPVQHLGLSGRQFAEKLLHSRNVLVSPGPLFSPSGSGHIRLSYATEDGRLREGLTRLAEFVRSLDLPGQTEINHAA